MQALKNEMHAIQWSCKLSWGSILVQQFFSVANNVVNILNKKTLNLDVGNFEVEIWFT